ncbi:MAG TPA: zf-HC2 domain-containing protein, partial [Candidatus Dormibacteraeota bacterium]|nr:zf-HC2 domain-containing protein [Candidatus Dormibacteraeota bacterium]
MKCSLLTLSCALDGELSRERQMELDAHLITCERCKTGMRYLREETERISLLAPVRLAAATTTALLERSRVLVPVSGSTELLPDDPSRQRVTAPLRAAPDPFGALGIGAAILDVPVPAEPVAFMPPEVAEGSSSESTDEEPDSELAHGSAFEAEEADQSPAAALTAGSEAMWNADTPEEASAEEMSETVAEEGQRPDSELAPEIAVESEGTDQSGSDALAAAPDAMWIAQAPEEVAAEDKPGLDPKSAFEGEEANQSTSDALAAVPEALWLADTPEEAASGEPRETRAPAAGGASPALSDDDISGAPSSPTEPTPTLNEDSATGARPSSMVVPGWEPSTELKMPWGDIPAATPATDGWAPNLAGIPVSRQTPLPPPAPFPAAPPPTRPAAAAVPGLQADRKASTAEPKVWRRIGGGGFRRPSPSKSGGDGPEERSWTRTGLISVAAVALVLILWNFTHGTTPAVTHHHAGRPTPSASAKPSPTAKATPSVTPTPLTLTGTQTLGSSGSGYQVQGIQYGVHGSQFWVVFHFSGGSGVPQI